MSEEKFDILWYWQPSQWAWIPIWTRGPENLRFMYKWYAAWGPLEIRAVNQEDLEVIRNSQDDNDDGSVDVVGCCETCKTKLDFIIEYDRFVCPRCDHINRPDPRSATFVKGKSDG